MDDKKIQKTLEFILDNQAQFTSDVLTLKELQTLSEKRISTLEKVSLNLFNEVRESTKNINELARIQSDMIQGQKELTADIKELRDAQKETNDRLNVVIAVFEKYLDKQDGKSK